MLLRTVYTKIVETIHKPKASQVNHPVHYNKNDIECIECIRACVDGYDGIEGFYVGNIVKYLYRANQKGGLESLEKAQWYMNELVRELKNRKKV